MTLTLERPCGCPPSASTGPSVLGQRVKIMEGVTNSGAGGQRVHIADVGKSQVGRVSQTVHIRPEEVTCTCWAVVENFDRADQAGWGTATPGGFDWDYNPTAGSISGGRGVLSSASDEAGTNTPLLGYEEVLDLAFEFQFDAAPGSGTDSWAFAPGSAARAEVHLGAASGDSKIRLTFVGGDSPSPVEVAVPTLDTGLWHAHIYTDLTSLKASIWADGGTEPTSWMAEIATASPTYDPNPLYLYWTLNDTATVYFDTISLNGCMADNFDRTEATGWGDSTDGHTWTTTTTSTSSGSTDDPSVDGSAGVLPCTLTNNGSRTHTMAVADAAPRTELTSVFAFSAQGAGGKSASLTYFVDAVNAVGVRITTSVPGVNGVLALIRSGGFTDDSTLFTLTAGVEYNLLLDHQPGVLSRAKVWAVGDAEPASWMVTRDATGEESCPEESSVRWQVTRGVGAVGSYSNTATIDYIRYR